jgi:hypothetical protein
VRRRAADATLWNNLAEKYASKSVENPSHERCHYEALMTPSDIGCGTGSLAAQCWATARFMTDIPSQVVNVDELEEANDTSGDCWDGSGELVRCRRE